MESRLRGERSPLTIGGGPDRLDGPTGALRAVTAVLAALWLSAPAGAAAVAIEDLEARPNPFSPNGDGFQDTTTLSFVPRGAGAMVTAHVVVRDAVADTLVETLWPESSIPTDATASFLWAPGSIADGRYRFDIRLLDGPDSATASAEVTADVTPPGVTLGSVLPDPFDPVSVHAGDSLRVPITVTTDAVTPTTTTVVIRQSGAPVDTLGTLAGAGSAEFRWGGHRAGSGLAVSGAYEAFAQAADLAGNADSTMLSFFLDVEAPVFRFSAGHDDTTQTTSFPVTLSGSVIDGTKVTSVVASFDGVTFVPVDSLSAEADSVYWEVVVTDLAPSPGWRDVTLRAFDVFGDVAGHRADHIQTIAYDTEFPATVSESVVLNENASVLRGQRLQIRTFWNRGDPPLRMSADASALDSAFPGAGAGFFTDEGSGVWLYNYDVSYTNDSKSGEKIVVIRAATPYLVAEDSVRVTLREGRPDPSQLVYIDRNWFDPREEDVTISSEFATTPLRVEIWNLAGRRVRVLEGEGLVKWNGTSDDGREVATGVYFLRVRTEDGEENRRVGVVRGGRR